MSEESFPERLRRCAADDLDIRNGVRFAIATDVKGRLQFTVGATDPSDGEILKEFNAALWRVSDPMRHFLVSLLAKGLVKRPSMAVLHFSRQDMPRTHFAELVLTTVERFRFFGHPVLTGDDAMIAELRAIGADAIVMPASVALSHDSIACLVLVADMQCYLIDKNEIHTQGLPFDGLRHIDNIFLIGCASINARLYSFVGYDKSNGRTSWRLDTDSNTHLRGLHLGRILTLTGKNYFRFGLGIQQMWTNDIGPINEVGCRVGGDFRLLAERDPHHLVIVATGGSAAWGWRIFHDNVVWAKIGRELTRRLRPYVPGCRVSVLNFALPSNVMLDEIRSFLLWAHQAKPDIVISHGGFNDIYFGAVVDPELVARYGVVYQAELDETPYEHPQPGTIDPDHVEMIARSIVNRADQYGKIAAAHGAEFFFGLQPVWHGGPLSAADAEGVDHWLRNYGAKGTDITRTMSVPPGYAAVERLLGKTPGKERVMKFVDVHGELWKRKEGKTAFLDVVHMTATGHAIMAEVYADHLEETCRTLLGRRIMAVGAA